jgi:hypothetical protein
VLIIGRSNCTNTSPGIISLWHVARMGEGRHVHRVLVRKPEGDPDVDGRIILRWIFSKWEGVVGTGWSWLRMGTGGGHLWVR